MLPNALFRVTIFCWLVTPDPKPPTPITNERFPVMMSLSRTGTEYVLQALPFVPWLVGQFTPLGRFALRTALLVTLTTPAGCGHDVIPVACEQAVETFWVLARGANNELNSTPEEAVELLETIVLLTMFTSSESSSETPPPSHPATLFAMMLFVS